MADRAGETVEAHNDKHVAGANFTHQRGKFRPGPRSARTVLLVDDPASRRGQFVGLGVVRLILRRDASVAQKAAGGLGSARLQGGGGQKRVLSRVVRQLYNIGRYKETTS